MPLESTRGKFLLSYLPEYYNGVATARLILAETESARLAELTADIDAELSRSSGVLAAICQALGVELDWLWAALDETLLQAFALTATWGLDRWEAELGLPPDTGLSTDERRARIISKLRGLGTITPGVAKAVAESFSDDTVTVIEDFARYTVTILFNSGTPVNFDEVDRQLREVMPAHLALSYQQAVPAVNLALTQAELPDD